MSEGTVVYVVGAGAVGMALSASLVAAGRAAVAVRTRDRAALRTVIPVSLHHGPDRLEARVETVGLSGLSRLEGIVAVTAKAYANSAIAAELAKKPVTGPIVVMQNGVGVEQPFLDAPFPEVYRCVLYLASQATSGTEYAFHAIRPSAMGIVRGNGSGLAAAVEALSTTGFAFRAEQNIQREIWKKAIVNAVFNSICPLLDTDNGVFARDSGVAGLAQEVVVECLALTDRLGLELTRGELLEQIQQVSRSSQGKTISTLQDIRSGRETEIRFLNLEMARIAAAQQPPIELPRTELLGRMTEALSRERSASRT